MIDEKINSLEDLLESIENTLENVKMESKQDLKINEFALDESVLHTPNLFSKYNELFSDNSYYLKELASFREKVKLERWKYYNGKQTQAYYKEHGAVHEKILKGDVDKYMAADSKLTLVNLIVEKQKILVEFIERCIKEIQTRNFHCKVAMDWRKFSSGA